ncbi:MAG: nucleotide exchange factor GrpE [Hyphomicrobiales bacterium]
MTDTTSGNDAAESKTESKVSEGKAAAAAPAPETAQPDPADHVAVALAAAADFKDRHLRALAEMENLRKRTERDVSEARLYGIAAFARDVLAVADNMHRALEAVGPELRQSKDASVKTLLEGIELTERELLKVLEKNGVKKLSPMGEKFDPNFHQAMYEIPDAEVPAGHVAQVMQAGYMIGERVLRPALVAISKGAAKAPAASANDNPDPQGPPPAG